MQSRKTPTTETSSDAVPDGDLPSAESPAASDDSNAAVAKYEDALLQYQIDLQRNQTRSAAAYMKVKREVDEDLQRRWLEAYRSYAEALAENYYSGPHVEEASQAYQRLADALAALQDTRASQQASHEAAQELSKRLAEAGTGADATEPAQQAYTDYLAQLTAIWDRSAAATEAQNAQRHYQDKLRAAYETAAQRSAESQQRYLDAVNAILSDDTLHRRTQAELEPLRIEVASSLEKAQRQCVGATIDGLRAYESGLAPPSPAITG
jgi:uncharacterized phage infection (PIP) family protein YhgE